jgi:hypothetical protein
MHGFKDIKEMIKNAPDNKVRFWVCDYLQNSGIGKVLRNVKPTYVELSIPAKRLKEVLQEGYNYTPQVNVIKNDKVTEKKVAYYGTTANDDGLYYFNTEKEAISKYNDLIFKTIKNVEVEKQSAISQFNTTINRLQESFIQSDYVMECLVRSHKQN